MDVTGLTFAYSSISDDFSRADQRQGHRSSTTEEVIEATYRINLAPWWNIQPDFQYIVNASGFRSGRPKAPHPAVNSAHGRPRSK